MVKKIIRYMISSQYRLYYSASHLSNVNRLYKRNRRRVNKHGNQVPLQIAIGKDFNLPHPFGVVIGLRVIIGDNCWIYQNVTIGQKNNLYPKIGNNVIIYPNSVIIGDITIGNNVTIGAGSVVLNSIPDNCIVAGNPAKIIKKL